MTDGQTMLNQVRDVIGAAVKGTVEAVFDDRVNGVRVEWRYQMPGGERAGLNKSIEGREFGLMFERPDRMSMEFAVRLFAMTMAGYPVPANFGSPKMNEFGLRTCERVAWEIMQFLAKSQYARIDPDPAQPEQRRGG